MRSAAIAARYEWRADGLKFLQRDDDVLAAADLRRIGLRADEHEIVVHHRVALDAVTFREKLFLGGASVHEHDVGIAAPRDIESLASSQGDDVDLDAGLAFEDRQQMAEQPGLFGRRRRGHGDEAFLSVQRRSKQRENGTEKDATDSYHGTSPSRNCAASADAGRRKNRLAGARSSILP